MNEIWKDIPGYEGLYQVSNKGRIKSFWFWSNTKKQRIYREKILKPKYAKKDKCGRVDLWRAGEHKTFLTYRLELCAFTGVPYESELTVNHKDGNRLNNNLYNLEWLSREANIVYGFDNGQYSTNHRVKVTNKCTKEEVVYRSKTKASIAVGKHQGYVGELLRKGLLEDEFYKYELVNRSN